MKNLTRNLALAGVAVSLFSGAANLQAQQTRGNFDPAQMQQRILDGYRERMEVKDDGEWKLISDRITKVMDAQRETRAFASTGGFGGFGGRPPGGGGGDNAKGGGDGNTKGRTRNGGGPGGGFTREVNPDADALSKAIEAKASADELKSKMARVRDARKAADAKLDRAQTDLREVLSVRQEAIALMAGLLK